MFLNCLCGSRALARIVPLNSPEPEDRGAALVSTIGLVFNRDGPSQIPAEGSVASINRSLDQNSSSRSRDQGIFNRIWGDRAGSVQGVDGSIHSILVRRFSNRDEEEIVLVWNDNRIIHPVE